MTTLLPKTVHATHRRLEFLPVSRVKKNKQRGDTVSSNVGVNSGHA